MTKTTVTLFVGDPVEERSSCHGPTTAANSPHCDNRSPTATEQLKRLIAAAGCEDG